jgi:nucleoside-diphosphate-sugar epimerase
LLSDQYEVVGVDAFRSYYARHLKEANLAELLDEPEFEFHELDVSCASIEDLVSRADGVFHLAAQPGVRASWGESFIPYVRDNILATQRIFEAAARAGVRVVFASSSSVYGDAESYPTSEDTVPLPISPYGVTKLSCEHLANAYARSDGLDAVGLRYFTVYGPKQRPDMAVSRIVQALLAGDDFVLYGTGEQTRDVTYVADAVSATIAVMEAAPAGSFYNVGGGHEVSLLEVIGTLERLAKGRLELRRERAAVGDVRRTAADTRRIRAAVGWRPATSLEDGLAAQLASVAETSFSLKG